MKGNDKGALHVIVEGEKGKDVKLGIKVQRVLFSEKHVPWVMPFSVRV